MIASESGQSSDVLVRVHKVKKYFAVTSGGLLRRSPGLVKAVDGVSFDIPRGATYGLVGESGCGKTTIAKLILQIEKPTAGQVMFDGRDLWGKGRRETAMRRGRMSVVFQDPSSSLDPRMRTETIIAEPLMARRELSRRQIRAEVDRALEEVHLPSSSADRYPHELSGGQRQRVAIARAIITQPRLVVLDEPVSSLDVSIRAQVMNLLKAMQTRYDMSLLLIAHNLATVRFMSHRVGVMYLGRIVEEADGDELFTNPLHPYTVALIAASMPVNRTHAEADVVIGGEPPSPLNPPPGCPFHPRCPRAPESFPRSVSDVPALVEVRPAHTVACHLY